MCMRLIATVQHHASAVYIMNALHSLLYPTMTSSLFITLNSMYAGM